MKPNAFQKILTIVYLFLLAVCCVFYVPFRNIQEQDNTKIVYDTIWSDNSNIDLYRIGIYLILLSVSFYFLYRFLNRMNDLDASVYKKKAKSELITFMIFISGIVICLLFLFCSNFINQIRREYLTSEIQKTQSLILEKSASQESKRAIRSNFWDVSARTYNLAEFDNNIQNYWQALIRLKDDSVWLNSFYGKFSSDDLVLLNIKSPTDLKHFIEINTYDDVDIAKQKEVKVLNTELSPLITKKESLTSYQNEEIRKIALICFTILFGILYIIRPLLLFIKGIFTELK